MELEQRKSFTRRLTIVAQDPSVTINHRILTIQVEVPRRKLTDALKDETHYLSTQSIRKKDVFSHLQEFEA